MGELRSPDRPFAGTSFGVSTQNVPMVGQEGIEPPCTQ